MNQQELDYPKILSTLPKYLCDHPQEKFGLGFKVEPAIKFKKGDIGLEGEDGTSA
jgi:hypothetical protein